VVQFCPNVVIVLSREDVEVHFHALESIAEQFNLCEWGHYHLKKKTVSLFGNTVWIMGCT
jgi:hypothetical protein